MNFEKHINLFKYSRLKTRSVKLGNIEIGGNNPIRIQSMTSTNTLKTDETVDQSLRIIKAGGELVRITTQGVKEAENLKKIEISKANQEAKRKQMQTKEKLIDTCFQDAIQNLKELDDIQYEKIIIKLIEKGREQINDAFYIQSSKPLDKKIAEKQKITVKGTIDASGGIRLISEKGTITIDNTFEGILTRKKQEIRVHVGNILFP